MVGLVETMVTADSFQLAAYGLGWMQRQKRAGAVSRRPMADVRQIAATDKQADALVYDWSDSGKCRPTAQLYGLTEDEIRIVGAGEK
jgi:hypothetical protein